MEPDDARTRGRVGGREETSEEDASVQGRNERDDSFEVDYVDPVPRGERSEAVEAAAV